MTELRQDHKPKRLSLSEIVELLLTRRPSASSVTLSRAASGDTAIEVKVSATEAGTIAEAEAEARATYDRLREAYPDRQRESSAISLTRNAKGDTQVDLTARTGDEYPTLEALYPAAVKLYDNARAKYPMANGLTAKPGSVS